MYDFGGEGVTATLEELEEAQVLALGIGRTFAEARRPRIVTTASGIRVGFLGYTTCFNVIDESLAGTAALPDQGRIKEDISRL